MSSSSPLSTVQLHLVDTIDELFAMSRWIGERREGPVCFDVESEGLDPFRHKVRLVQIGDKTTAWAVPYELWGGGVLELLRKYEGELAGHNASFDHRMLKVNAGLDLPWSRLHDTMTLAAIDDPVRSKGLKELAALLIDPFARTGQKALDDGMKRRGWTWATVPLTFEPYWVYAACDVIFTAHLFDIFHQRVMMTSPQVYDLERAVSRICSRMMLAGMATDAVYIRDSISKLRAYADECRSWLKEYHGITSPLSAKQISSALEAAGHAITERTATGLPRTDKEVLEGVRDFGETPAAKEIARCVLNVRMAEKGIGSYLENFLACADEQGVVHPQIWTMAARTHRMSISEPALQTLTRDMHAIRGSFVPRPGCALISIDASQIEMRLAASISRDEGLIRAFREADAGGRDFYSGVATELFRDEVTKGDPRRQLTKNMSFAKVYGAGVSKMARMVGLPASQVRPVYDAFNERFPGLERLSRKLNENAARAIQAGERPVVRTDIGRMLPVDRDKIYAGINYRIQGTAGDVLKRGLVELESAGYGDMLRCVVHDECIIECPSENAEDVLREVSTVLTSVGDGYAVPIPWEGKIMRERWEK